MKLQGITRSALRRIAQELDLPEVEEAAEPIEDTERGHGPPHTLFHTTSEEGATGIADDGAISPKDENAFVSFSAKPVSGGDLEGTDVVLEVAMPDGVMEVEYTRKWFDKYPEHAAYIAGEEWQETDDDVEDPMFEAFMAKDSEAEWISGEQGKLVQTEIVDTDVVGQSWWVDEVVAEYEDAGEDVLRVNVATDSLVPSETTQDPEKIEAILEELRDGWAEDMPPLLVQEIDGQYVIMDGHHRWLAAQEAGLPEVPVVVYSDGEDTDMLYDLASDLELHPNRVVLEERVAAIRIQFYP